MQNQDFKLNRTLVKNPSESLKIRIENLLLINNILKIVTYFFPRRTNFKSYLQKKIVLIKDHDDDIEFFMKIKKKY